MNMTNVRNKVTELPANSAGEEIGITTAQQQVTEGESVYSWYMPTWAGVDPANGAPLWYVEGNSGETTSTYSEAGKSFHKSAAPTFFGGLTNRFDFMGIYLSANLYYATGYNVYDTYGYYTMSDGQWNFTYSNGYARLYDRWQKPGDVSQNPKNVYGNPAQSSSHSTRRLYDGEYLRLRDLTLGYNLPASLISNIGLSAVNIYLKGTNLWTWRADDNLEFDPESGADGFLSINAPPVKTYNIGLIVSF